MAEGNGEAERDVLLWAGALRDQSRPLFSKELKPSVSVKRALGAYTRPGRPRFVVDSNLLEAVVGEVVRKRRSLIAGAEAVSLDRSDFRRLRWYPELTDFIAMGVETGLVDDCDAPAWDLWSGVERREGHFCVVSVVPSWLTARADQAVSFSPTHCLEWE